MPFCMKIDKKNYSSADGKYEVRLMTKAELKYTGGKKRREITKYFIVKLSAKNTTMYRNGNV